MSWRDSMITGIFSGSVRGVVSEACVRMRASGSSRGLRPEGSFDEHQVSREVTREMATGLVCLCGWCLLEGRVALPRSALSLAVRLLGLPTVAVWWLARTWLAEEPCWVG